MKNRILSWLLALCLTVTMLPAAVLAAEGKTIEVSDAQALAEAIGNAGDGDIIELQSNVVLTEAVSITENVTIDGQGHTLTASGCAGLYIRADLDRLEVRNLTLLGLMHTGQAGETMAGEPFMGIGTYNGGFGVGRLTLTDVTVDGFTYGLYFGQNPAGNTDPIRETPVRITAKNLTVRNCYAKGIYAEKLTDSTFTACVFANNGSNPEKVASSIQTWMCGVDLNLKNGTYRNLTFDGCTFTGNGTNRGTALHIKARNDGSYGADTRLTGVTVTGCTFAENNAADTGAGSAAFGPVVLGEPGKNNPSPTNVAVQSGTAFTNHVAGTVVVTFDAAGGTGDTRVVAAAGGTIDPLPAASRSGYTFNGWYTAETDGEQITTGTVFDGDTTVYAQWSEAPSTPSGGGSSSGSTTETVTHPDGSTTTTVTKPDGTTTETTTDTQGNKTETVTKPDGSATTTVANQDGSASTTTVSKDGQMESEVQLPAAVVAGAQEKNEAVSLPMPEVPVTSDRETAPTVTVKLPANTAAKVEIPVENVTAGTVAILVRPDGTEEVVRTSVPTENGVTLTVEDGATVKIVDNAVDFADVADAYWGADAIDFATSRELFNGTSATRFSPENTMTRAMIVTVLARYEGVDTTTGGEWYEAGAQWAVENGISDGSGLDGSVTREQLAAMLYRYVGEPKVSGTATGFSDAGDVSGYAADAMAWAIKTGLINGMTDGSLKPRSTATRAQVAAILARFAAAIG